MRKKINNYFNKGRSITVVRVDAAVFAQVMENLERHGILPFHFPGLESSEIVVWVN